MTENRYLSLKRFSRVMRKDIAAGYRSVIVTAVALAGVIFLLTFLTGIQPGGVGIHPGLWTGFLLGGGFIVTSLMFKEMHSKDRGHDWHMLPASSMEKFISRLLLSSLGWILGLTAVYWIASSLGEGVNRLIFGHGNPLFNPFTRYSLTMCIHYCILQSLFLLGAAYFRKAHFVKTILFINLINIAIGVIALLLLKLFFWDVFTWEMFSEDAAMPAVGWINWGIVEQEAEDLFMGLARVMKIVYFSVFAPVLWVIAYFRVAEKEVRNGV